MQVSFKFTVGKWAHLLNQPYIPISETNITDPEVKNNVSGQPNKPMYE